MTIGFIDRSDRFIVEGWAFDEVRNAPPQCRLFVDGDQVAIIDFQITRPDAPAAAQSTKCGFRHEFSPPLKGRNPCIEIVADDGFILRMAEQAVQVQHSPDDEANTRAQLSRKFLHGKGIEIGALQQPLPISNAAIVTYVDRMTVAELRKHYPELESAPLVEPDVVDDGEHLGKFHSGSQDFVIANHFIEHAEDPITCLKTFTRVLKQGGTLYLAIPDKRHTFDAPRDLTEIAHLQIDHEQGSGTSRRAHYLEWARHVYEGGHTKDPQHAAELLESMGYSIHFHVWTGESFLGFLGWAIHFYNLPLRVLRFVQNNSEFIIILRKVA